ncbi:DUF7948 domain-containing protein [Croceimicrobium hydrocarbonivorans]|uniref:Gliding motility-associated C-terminal domain-containing protein n=1 Tax=Croceimicrobium hydrocarbonivorans TaxID=2761580 RepID=A0A7H0VHS2_9FLAO|nr:gliding motility-associated C-terminal domain-containing protein [Croceimicrobium hydrocarbonivorans]QNR25270.1 gliding motility-associated C-terminal domain-containing protein [Croceimicrobium hydrocarbonivorans]
MLSNLLEIEILRCLILSIFLVFGLSAQEVGFVPNAGQWEGNFDFRFHGSQGYVFLKAGEQRVMLVQRQHHDHQWHHQSHTQTKGHVYRIHWLGADTNARVSSELYPNHTRLNFLFGSNRARWKSGLNQYQIVTYHNVYPQIDLRYVADGSGYCRFDFILHPGADPELIRWEIEGADKHGIAGSDLALITSVGSAIYTAPRSYQEKEEIASDFKRFEDGSYGFDLAKYDHRKELLIDPTLVFSTYSGSTDDNFGFSATYGIDGSAYGAGINYGHSVIHRGFPTTLGAFQDSSQGGIVDISIAKYNPQGTAQIYATYLGGDGNDLPFSLLEGPDKSLIVMGVTGSVNFPTHPNSFDTSFAQGPADMIRIGGSLPFPVGSDIFVTVLDSSGGALLGSTFFGDTLSDGNNKRMMFNYGDPARGDITLDSQGNIIISSYTFSSGLATGSASDSHYRGEQDGLIVSFNPDLSQLNWARYLGGEDNDASFSLRYTNTGRLFVAGSSESDTLAFDTSGVYQPMRAGKVDAFLAELNPQNGDVLKWTFSGTAEDDRAYFVDYTPDGNLVIFGQTAGPWPWIGNNVWGIPNSSQFIQELSPDLQQVRHSTTFGDGLLGVTDISPTALMVSDCGDVFLSGWGAPYNSSLRGVMGDTRGLPVTPDAYRDTADNRGDFYFMRLDASWQELEYATFFGQWQNGADHVDGGSSRFRRDGSIFQAVCSCGSIPYGFPITPNAFEDTVRSGNCNMAVFRFDMEADTVRCEVDLAKGVPDSTCLPAEVKFVDRSFNADVVLVIDPQGNVDTLTNQIFTVQDSGLSVFRFVALDTNCNLVDSSQVLIYGFNNPLEADFNFEYDSCDASGIVQFKNLSIGAGSYQWDFGDGNNSNASEPSHTFLPGNYTIQLIVEDPICNQLDTLEQELEVHYRSNKGEMLVESDACDPERKLKARADLGTTNPGDFHAFEWYVDGQLIGQGDSLNYQFLTGGSYELELRFLDTLCNRSKSETYNLYYYDESFELKFPNIFTPNGDGMNDEFTVLDLESVAPFLERATLEVYNRNGLRIYAGDLLQASWNGKSQGQEVPDAVYFYIFNYEDICGQTKEQNGFFHLER